MLEARTKIPIISYRGSAKRFHVWDRTAPISQVYSILYRFNQHFSLSLALVLEHCDNGYLEDSTVVRHLAATLSEVSYFY